MSEVSRHIAPSFTVHEDEEAETPMMWVHVFCLASNATCPVIFCYLPPNPFTTDSKYPLVMQEKDHKLGAKGDKDCVCPFLGYNPKVISRHFKVKSAQNHIYCSLLQFKK